MDILVTGATGFLGTALRAHLESLGHRVVRLGSRNCDLTKPDALRPFDDRRYDQIYHLAAWTQAGDFCLRHPGEQWIINQQINTNVLSWWSDAATPGQADRHGNELRLRSRSRARRGQLSRRPADRQPLHLRHDQANALRRSQGTLTSNTTCATCAWFPRRSMVRATIPTAARCISSST